MSNPTGFEDTAASITMDSSAAYIAGKANYSVDAHWRIEKRNLTDGSLVASFGTGGAVTSDPSTGFDAVYQIVIDSIAMYIVGFDKSPVNNQWRIEKRALSDGSYVGSFGTGGVIVSNPGGDSTASGIAIDSTAMYIAGNDSALGNRQWRIEKRLLTDGSLIASFGSVGVITSNPSTGNDYAYKIAIDSQYLYAAGIDSSPGNEQWRIEKRSLATGALEASFGTSGVITSNPSGVNDVVYGLVIDGSWIYVVGNDYSSGNEGMRLEKRSNATGALDAGFGTNGVIQMNPSVQADAYNSIILDSSVMYIGGRDSVPGNYQWRVEKRRIADGSLVNSFGTGGVRVWNASSEGDAPCAMVMSGSALYMCGFDSTLGAGNEQWVIVKWGN